MAFTLGAVLSLCIVAAAQEPAADLVWRSGESLPGQITGASKDTLSFHAEAPGVSGLFTQPAEIRIQRVEELRFTAPVTAREEEFWIRLRDGGRLLAALEGMEQEWLQVRSALLGDAKLRLRDVVSVERARGAGMLLFGAGPDVGWQESPRIEEAARTWAADPFAARPNEPLRVRRVNRSGRSRDGQPEGGLRLWRPLPGGGFSTLSWAGVLSAPLPEAAVKEAAGALRLDLHLSASAAPQFIFRLGLPAGEVRLETWNDRLVLREGQRFQAVAQPLRATDKELALTLLWNTATGEARLLEESGRELAALGPVEKSETDPVGSPPPERGGEVMPRQELPGGAGVSLENLGPDLTLRTLNVVRWEGGTPMPAARGEAHARLMNGRVISGQWVGMEDGSAVLRDAADGASVLAPLAELASLQTGTARDAESSEPAQDMMRVDVHSLHGEWLRGGFAGIRANGDGATAGRLRLRLDHPSFKDGCGLALAALRSVNWPRHPEGDLPAAEDNEAFSERLTAGTTTVRGRAVAAGDALPRWLFDGALEAVPLHPGAAVKIERDPRHIAPARMELEEGSVLLCLKDGDMLPARLRTLGPQGLAFAAPGVLSTTLRSSAVAGLLIPGPALVTEGFADPGWRQVSGDKPLLAGEDRAQVLLAPGHALAHPAMMAGDGLEFRLHDEIKHGVTSLRLTLYAGRMDQRSDGVRLLVAIVGDDIYCGDELENGQMRHQGQTVRGGEDALVQIRAQGEQLMVRVNGTEVVQVPLPEGMRRGSGLILEPGALWGNQPQPVRVSDFRARHSMPYGRVPMVEEEARNQVLTIPRSHAEDFPRHALIAPNGDVLRGTVEDWGREVIELRWGMESWSVPRGRVAAVALLDPPPPGESAEKAAEAQPAPASVPPPHWLLLANGGRLGLTLTRWAEDGIVGRHPLLGRVLVPADSLRSFHARQPPLPSDAHLALSGWQTRLAPPPALAGDAPEASALLGKQAADFTLPLLEGGDFVLQEKRGKVVVLDFWATWCAPCLKALPELMAAWKDLPSDQALLVGVNQGEPAAHVGEFIAARQWALTTVLDAAQEVGRKFEVKGIPHTVVIDQQGRIALIKTGYSPEAAAEIVAKVRELLQGR